MNTEPVLKVIEISKSFGGVKALTSVSLEINSGECHALIGENGAGKSTLINILNGACIPDEGCFIIDQKKYYQITPRDSINSGINVIHQEVALVDSLTVMENIFLSELGDSSGFFVKKKNELRNAATAIIDQLGCPIAPDDIVENLSTSKKQIIEIAKALASNPKILIMDEPTAALTKGEAERLFEIINKLKTSGISIIFVSHRIDEVMQICDRISVLRDGHFVGTVNKSGTSISEIIKMMVGRELDLYAYLAGSEGSNDKVLEVEDFNCTPHFRDISFHARAGEILGFSGLVGAGRSELAQAVFGFLKKDSGRLRLHGKEINISKPSDAIRSGIGYLPEDRKVAAAISTMNVRENLSITVLSNLTKGIFINSKKENTLVKTHIEKLMIKTSGSEAPINTLSGGNQQKVMLGRWLAADIDVLIVDEPTQGVDVGAKSEIHRLLRELAQQGVAVIVISSDLPEIMAVSDRILVMRFGEISGEVKASEATPEKIMTLATVGSGCR